MVSHRWIPTDRASVENLNSLGAGASQPRNLGDRIMKSGSKLSNALRAIRAQCRSEELALRERRLRAVQSLDETLRDIFAALRGHDHTLHAQPVGWHPAVTVHVSVPGVASFKDAKLMRLLSRMESIEGGEASSFDSVYDGVIERSYTYRYRTAGRLDRWEVVVRIEVTASDAPKCRVVYDEVKTEPVTYRKARILCD